MIKNLDPQDKINLRICHNFLEGEILPDEIRKQERYFELMKNDEEAQNFCNEFEKRFDKKLTYKIFRGNAYFKYDSIPQ